jgi:ubiquinone/menaquinone biosynthesis C-methylase UbiE
MKITKFFKVILIAMLCGVGWFLFMILIGARILRRFIHFPAPSFVGYFLDSDLRRKMQPPEWLVQRSGIEKGMTVLEVGCGSGAYTTFAARAVGEQGKVFALDIQPEMLEQLRKKLSKPENQDIVNIELKQASAYELPFAEASIDLVYMVTVLEEIPDRGRALQEVLRVLKPGGTLAVTEFLIDPDYPLVQTTIQRVTQAGFQFDQIGGNLWNYTVRFKKAEL